MHSYLLQHKQHYVKVIPDIVMMLKPVLLKQIRLPFTVKESTQTSKYPSLNTH